MQKFISALVSSLFEISNSNTGSSWHRQRSDQQLKGFVERRLALNYVPIEIED